MNTEGLSEVEVKDAQPVVEQIAETPPELNPCRWLPKRTRWWQRRRR